MLECPPGYAGPNCAYSCDYPTYGEDCLRECACSVDQCDFRSGCKVTNKPALSTKAFTSRTMKTNSVGYRNAENATTDLNSSQRKTAMMDFVISLQTAVIGQGCKWCLSEEIRTGQTATARDV
uniref:EGF-like domain-containing protein n=1 Tax=Magallana gigas TaxID=29159 RepID=A0A8W8MRA2_MAGGI